MGPIILAVLLLLMALFALSVFISGKRKSDVQHYEE